MSIQPRPSLGRRGRLIAVLAAGLLLVPALAGCGMNPVESIIEGATGGNVDIGGTSIPDDFPAEVPLIDGEVINSLALGKGADKVWTVILKVADASAAGQIKGELEAAGFTQEFDQTAGSAAGIAYKNANYGVLVAVTEDGNNGWAASYAVTPARP